MLHKPPGGKQWASWLWVVLWSLLILSTIPLARTIQTYVSAHWGSATFTYVVLTVIASALAFVIGYLIRLKTAAGRHYVWLVSTSAIFIAYTLSLRESPEEAVHFIQYGVLGVLLFRALSHRVRDVSIYLAAAIIGAFIGTIDEAIQWLTPERYWAYSDIWLNFLAVALVQITIAKGLDPRIISGTPKPHGIQFTSRLLIALLLLFVACLLNTPARVAWYAARMPALESLKHNPSTMTEYGFLYTDSRIGVFRSRLSPEELRRQDAERGEEAARILDAYRKHEDYKRFLDTYMPHDEPLVYEARIHLFRRDTYLARAKRYRENKTDYQTHMDVAYRENWILEHNFPNTLKHSSYILPPDTLSKMQSNHLPDTAYDSAVSQHLITRVSESQILSALFLAIAALILVDRFYARSCHAKANT